MRKYCSFVSLLLLVMVGCVNQPVYRARVEYGYGEPVLIGDWTNHHGSGQPIDVHLVSIKAIVPVAEYKSVRFDLPIGPYAVCPQRFEGSTVLGGEITPRAVYTGWEKFNPYFEWVGGINYTKEHWEHQGSSFNFDTGAGIGVLLPVSPKIDLSVGYRYWHLSNAGTSYPNDGYNSDLVLLGVEYKF
jgi:opacity protein-like surface antigen